MDDRMTPALSIPSYPKVWTLGHAGCDGILDDPVRVQEKIDGSQFTFAQFTLGGGQPVLQMRSHHCEVRPGDPGMFKAAVAAVEDRFAVGLLEDGLIYRGEYLTKPKHNTLAYERTPKDNIILFDIQDGARIETYLSRADVEHEANRLGFEVVPDHGEREVTSMADLSVLMGEPSCLGGPREGVVLKNYGRFGRDGKVLMAKFVSQAYKETHKTDWHAANPSHWDILGALTTALTTEARWRKAVEARRDAGTLLNDPADIGPLIRDIQADVAAEEREEILKALWAHAWPRLTRMIVRGFPDWYKGELAQRAFPKEKS